MKYPSKDKIDLSVFYDIKSIKNLPKCFTEHDEDSRQCQNCSLNFLCIHNKFLSINIEQQFLDDSNFSLVDWKKLQNYIDTNSPSYNEVFEYVKQISNCVDDYAIKNQISYNVNNI